MSNFLPDFSQGENKTCETASLVSSIIIHDRLSGPYNKDFAGACKIVASYFEKNLETVKSIIESQQAEDFVVHLNLRSKEIRNTEMIELDYLVLANCLYTINLAEKMKLKSTQPGEELKIILENLGLKIIKSTRQLAPLKEILSSKELISLKSGEIAQIVWWVIDPKKRNEPLMSGRFHAFLMGRINSIGWFLHDQAFSPAKQLPEGKPANSLDQLKKAIYKACNDGKYWLYTGTDKPASIKFSGIRILMF